jgi:DDE superfamily endonuclease
MELDNDGVIDAVVFTVVIMNVSLVTVIYQTQILYEAYLKDVTEFLDRYYNHHVPLTERRRRHHWSELKQSLSDPMFRRMFRMKKEWFDDLCKEINDCVGDRVFKSENWLNDDNNNSAIATSKASDAWGGIVSGEMKVACTLRMLAGGSYVDILMAYNISNCQVYTVFHEVIGWIGSTFAFPLTNYLLSENIAALKVISEGFSKRSDGVFKGCIGALDGLAIRIKCPNRTLDGVCDPKNYFCRKGFFALNVQAICDHEKRVIWLSTGHKGSTHDSTAFGETTLSVTLKEKADFLHDNRMFICGDSAYPLLSYLICPYNTESPQSMEDVFNYYHSSCRINIECAFGEVIMRWGIFWRKLQFNLAQAGKIINAAFLLHNFIIDKRVGTIDNAIELRMFESFSIFDQFAGYSLGGGGDLPRALVTDNNAINEGGRPVLDHRGMARRDNITVDLVSHGLKRRLKTGMKYNRDGHVYMTY